MDALAFRKNIELLIKEKAGNHRLSSFLLSLAKVMRNELPDHVTYQLYFDLILLSFEEEPLKPDEAWVEAYRELVGRQGRMMEKTREACLLTIQFFAINYHWIEQQDFSPEEIYFGVDTPWMSKVYNSDLESFLDLGTAFLEEIYEDDPADEDDEDFYNPDGWGTFISILWDGMARE